MEILVSLLVFLTHKSFYAKINFRNYCQIHFHYVDNRNDIMEISGKNSRILFFEKKYNFIDSN